MRSKKKTGGGGGGAANQIVQNTFAHQPQLCFEGETLARFLKSVHREIESAILLASDCNPRSLTKHLPALAASRNVPVITAKDRKEGSLRLGELIKVKTAIAIGVKVKGNAINQVIEVALTDKRINSIEDEAMDA